MKGGDLALFLRLGQVVRRCYVREWKEKQKTKHEIFWGRVLESRRRNMALPGKL